MSIESQFATLQINHPLSQTLTEVQDLSAFQQEYRRALETGLIAKRSYNLAPVDVVGVCNPQTVAHKASDRLAIPDHAC